MATKKFLAVVAMKDPKFGLFTHKTTIDTEYPLMSELAMVLNHAVNLYFHLGEVSEVLLVQDDKPFATLNSSGSVVIH